MYRWFYKARYQFLTGIFFLIILAGSFAYFDWQSKYADAVSFLNDRSAEIIGAAPLKAPGLFNMDLTGAGQIVGIADSGLDKGSTSDIHPDLASEEGKIPKVVMLKSYSGREVPDDPSGHGTHMAATIAGNGSASQGKYQGIASGASLYFQALLNPAGQLIIPESISNLFQPAYDAGVRVHVDGWGTGSNIYGERSSQIDQFVYRHPDFLPVFGAGNSGPTDSSLTMEANSKNALVIGSSQVARPAFSPEASQTDQIADSSSRGPAEDGRIKPDILAPGSVIISACSSLVESNFEANPLYTRMGGTSMASAVTGGSIALLRQYLNSNFKLHQPSAALIKALLINGARLNSQSGAANQGFGILDLYGTFLALQEEMFKFSDTDQLAAEETKKYSVKVTDTENPLRVTLCWTDPSADAGSEAALLNDLDLQIKAPDGTIYHGNGFLTGEETADRLNNVEQILIPEPQKGEYIISVQAFNLDSRYPLQRYALVYGQNLGISVVSEVENNQLHLSNGSILNINSNKIINGSGSSEITIGAQVYEGAKKTYIFADQWESRGIKPLSTQAGQLMVEMNTQQREGGYFIDPNWLIDQEGQVQLNEKNIDVTDLPDGVKINATINPVLQTLWDVKANGQKFTGYIAKIDAEKSELYLLGESEGYKLTDQTAISFHSEGVDSSVAALPFGYVDNTDITDLLPGLKVDLLLDTQTKEVYYINAERQVVVAQISSVDTEKNTIQVDTGKTYGIFPGVDIYKDFSQVELKELKPGDWLVGLVLDGAERLLDIKVLSKLSWGRVIFASNRLNTLYMLDQENQFQRYDLSGDLEIYRGGTSIDKGSLLPGEWVRVLTLPETNQAIRVDVAEVAEDSSRVFAAYYNSQRIMRFADGSSYTCQPSTLFVSSGYPISPLDILPGETVKLTALAVPSPAQSYIARVEVEKKAGVIPPNLQFNAYGLNGALIIQGKTNADRLSLYREDGNRQTVAVREDGTFSQVFSLLEGEEELRVMALDSRTGGVSIRDSVVISYPVEENDAEFPDILSHPARREIEALKSLEIVHGYEDGSFRPDQPISRLEFFTMLVNAVGEKTAPLKNIEKFSDYHLIPWWGLNAVDIAREEGWVTGYPDGSFRPNQALTQGELNSILRQLAADSLIKIYNPASSVSRADAARVIYRIYQEQEE